MQSFGTEEYGNKNEFKIVCCNCGKEARLVPHITMKMEIIKIQRKSYWNLDVYVEINLEQLFIIRK